MRLKCKKRQRHLLVYVDGWTVQKSLLHEHKLQKPLEIPIFQFASRFKIQADSFHFLYCLRKLNEKYGKNRGLNTPFPS